MENKPKGSTPEHTEQAGGSYFTLLIVMVLGVFVAILNETLLNVALPEIMKDFNVTESTVQWLSTGYLLIVGVIIPITAFLMERYTTRMLFLTAMALFFLGTLLAALAPSFGVLLLGRLIQALGTAIVFPLLTNVVFAVVPFHKRGATMGMIGIVITFAPALGPTISGIIVQYFSWRVLFYGVLPFAFIVIVYAAFALRNVTERKLTKLDTPSFLLSTLGFGGIVYAFSSAGEGHGSLTSWTVLVPLVVGIMSLLLFIVRQNRLTSPMLDLSTFRFPMFRSTVYIMMIVMMSLFSSMMLLPMYFQNALGFSAFQAGLSLLPGGLIMGIMSPINGNLFDRYGARWLAIIGLGSMIIAFGGYVLLGASVTFIVATVLNSFLMLGVSMSMMPVMTNGLNHLPRPLYPHGTAIVSTLQQVAGAIGMALLVTVMTTRSRIYEEGVLPETGDAVHAQAMTVGIQSAFLLALVFVIFAFVLAFFISRAVQPEGEGERMPAH